MQHNIANIASHFDIQAKFVNAEPYGAGHINDTYLATYNRDGQLIKYVYQRMNPNIFKNPAQVMENIVRVTRHQKQLLEESGIPDQEKQVMTFMPAVDGLMYYQDEGGSAWRCYMFIEAFTKDVVSDPEQALQIARAFGTFQKRLCTLPGERLHETIPDFHNTPKRFQALENAIENDPENRAMQVKREINFALEHKNWTNVLINKHKEGLIPERITHNDTKASNVLLDIATGKGICVIDLDTVMPGFSIYDFGDMVRSATVACTEDETDFSKATMRMPLFKALVKGFIESAGDVFTKTEIEHLAFGSKLITFEIGIRFLTDYILGDKYFKIYREKHNLDRCRVQFNLVQSMIEQEYEMNQFVASYLQQN